MSTVRELGHFVDGKQVAGASGDFGQVYDPNTGAVQAQVALADQEETQAAVASAHAAQPHWAAWNPQRRARVLLKFLQLIESERDQLAKLLSSEHGKTLADAQGDIQRGLEVAEFAVGIPHLLKGEFTGSAGTGIDTHSLRQPLGVVAGISPFNFPAMVPLWQLAPSIACGNAFVLKPSERDPSVPLRIAELFLEAGLPPGVLNVVNGARTAVNTLLTDPRVAAVGFVGSTPVAEHVYQTASAGGKRAQCFGGAKNHMVIMPDADLDAAVEALLGAGYGSAGERCMAISVAVPVGRATGDALVAKLLERAAALKVGHSFDETADFGPLIGPDALERVRGYIEVGVQEGAHLALDGRGFSLPGHENGFFLGPCLFDHVAPQMRIYREEIFGPVLSVVRVDDYESALRLPSEHEFGNGVSIFTRSGDVARDFTDRVQVGMVGVNVAIPVPVSYHVFGGWKRSGFGDLGQHGPDSIRFNTKTKTVTSRWSEGGGAAAQTRGPAASSFVIPTMQ